MDYLGSKFVINEVNSVLKTFGLKPNNKIGAWIHVVIVILFLISVFLSFWGLCNNIFQSGNFKSNYSTTSYVFMRDYPADQNIINLDNVGTLRPFETFYTKEPSTEVTLALNLPVTVLNDEMAPVSMGSAYAYKNKPEGKDLFHFNTTSEKSHEVELEGRVFLVRLTNIKDISSNEKGQNYIYEFSIREK